LIYYRIISLIKEIINDLIKYPSNAREAAKRSRYYDHKKSPATDV